MRQTRAEAVQEGMAEAERAAEDWLILEMLTNRVEDLVVETDPVVRPNVVDDTRNRLVLFSIRMRTDCFIGWPF